MNKVWTVSARWVKPAWVLPLALLTLPNCGFHSQASISPKTAVFCDIEVKDARHCATDQDKAIGIRLAEAAIALNEGKAMNVGLDDSPAALQRYSGQPEAVPFKGSFPQGQPFCPALTDPFDIQASCVSACENQFGHTDAKGNFIPDDPPDPTVVAFCQAAAHPSTNVPASGFTDGCTDGGKLRDDFVEPRKDFEPVVWDPASSLGVSPGGSDGSTLTRTAPTTGAFDAGGGSGGQAITRGDGFLEFAANEQNTARLGGLTTGASADVNPDFATINFAIDFFTDSQFFVFENGVKAAGPGINGAFGSYAQGDRFRISVRDNFDGTATISYAKVVGPCNAGTPCQTQVFYTSPTHATYPLHVDSSFREQGGTLANVRLVRIR
jgi:hypothetical protein